MLAPQQCVMLVGGRGTRLGALTADTPKPLLPVGGRPFLEYLLLEAARLGFRRILLLAGFGGEQVVNYARAESLGPRIGVTVEVVVEDGPADRRLACEESCSAPRAPP
jgi:D-glycero-alpha-D-manno-heptose 1-phosphate guanylyltransferase